MFTSLIEKLQRREDLTTDEAAAAMEEIMDGRAQPAQIAGLLVALTMKGERPSEIIGLARVMRSRAARLSREHARASRRLPRSKSNATGSNRSARRLRPKPT